MEKANLTVTDKIRSQSVTSCHLDSKDSLSAWMHAYIQIHVIGAPEKTQTAKQRDLDLFRRYFQREVGHDRVDAWTPAVSKQFQSELLKTISPKTNQPYAETTVNRVLATLRHFSRWVHRQRPFLAGNPFEGVRDVQTDEPDWNGLTPRQVLRLKSACEQRIKACTRYDQNPLLEAAVFYVLNQTGLRESELAALNIGQYHHKGLHEVKRRKNKRVSKKVTLPPEAREFLERYLATRPQAQPEDPLFVSRYGNRLHEQDIRRGCSRILKQANTYLTDDEKFHFTPHMLRHTFLKKVTDEHGVHFAQRVSGNVSVREIFRYAKPSQDEIDQSVEALFR